MVSVCLLLHIIITGIQLPQLMNVAERANYACSMRHDCVVIILKDIL